MLVSSRTLLVFVLFVFQVHVLFRFFVLLASTSAIDCLGRFISEMTRYMSTGT